MDDSNLKINISDIITNISIQENCESLKYTGQDIAETLAQIFTQ